MLRFIVFACQKRQTWVPLPKSFTPVVSALATFRADFSNFVKIEPLIADFVAIFKTCAIIILILERHEYPNAALIAKVFAKLLPRLCATPISVAKFC